MSIYKIIIDKNSPILPGSISTAYAKCGKKNCVCSNNPAKLHGPYYRWTGLIDKRQTTIALNKLSALECSRRIKNYKKLVKEWDALIRAALKNAPWNSS